MPDPKLTEMENDVITALQGWNKFSKKYASEIPKEGESRKIYDLETGKMKEGFVPTSHISRILRTDFKHEERYVSSHMKEAVEDLKRQGKIVDIVTGMLEPRRPQDPNYDLYVPRRGIKLSYPAQNR